MDGKPLEKLEILFLGEDFFSLRGTTENGEKMETAYVKLVI